MFELILLDFHQFSSNKKHDFCELVMEDERPAPPTSHSPTSLLSQVFFGLTRLAQLELLRNSLTDLKAGWFELRNLERLNLGFNQLSVLRAGIFHNLPKLQKFVRAFIRTNDAASLR